MLVVLALVAQIQTKSCMGILNLHQTECFLYSRSRVYGCVIQLERLFVAKIPMRILNVRASRGRTDWAGAGAGAGAEPELDSSMADGSCNCG